MRMMEVCDVSRMKMMTTSGKAVTVALLTAFMIVTCAAIATESANPAGSNFISSNRITLLLSFEEGVLKNNRTWIESKEFDTPYRISRNALEIKLLDLNKTLIYSFNKSDPRIATMEGVGIIHISDATFTTIIPFYSNLAYVDVAYPNGTLILRVDVRADIREFCIMRGDYDCLNVGYYCGDSFCNSPTAEGGNETCSSCPKDCGSCKNCNRNGVCEKDTGETTEDCPSDCNISEEINPPETNGTPASSYCGNGFCDSWEDYLTCPSDCKANAPAVVCNHDGNCDMPLETSANCPDDCKKSLFDTKTPFSMLTVISIAFGALLVIALIIYYFIKTREKELEEKRWEE